MECYNCLHAEDCIPNNNHNRMEEEDCFDFCDVSGDEPEYLIINGEVYWVGMSYYKYEDAITEYLPEFS